MIFFTGDIHGNVNGVADFINKVHLTTVDDSTERWLDTIEESIQYKAWFCGHWHTDKRIDKMHFLFRSFESDEQFKR